MPSSATLLRPGPPTTLCRVGAEDGRGHLYLGDACEALGLLEESQKHRARGQQLLEPDKR